MTLKVELPVFPEGGIYPPEPKNQNTPPGRQILANTPLEILVIPVAWY